VITARTSSLPEVAGTAALYVDDPYDSQGIAQHLEQLRVVAEVRDRLRRAGRARARTFSWEATAGAVADVIRELVGLGPRQVAYSSSAL
jgi:alpha-1,3-rhamnosyl/mannosyltransferase